MDIYIISGLSGAGKSRAAAVLEDFDFYCVDNMPVAMMPKFAELCLATRGRYERVALVTDVRAIADVNEFFSALDDISALGCSYTILFIEAKTETIVKRYKETRRRHPLDPDGHDLLAAVRCERERMEPVRSRADHIIDTTGLTLGRLQRTLSKIITASSADQPLSVVFLSFGYKNGIPIEADLVFDVRFRYLEIEARVHLSALPAVYAVGRCSGLEHCQGIRYLAVHFLVVHAAPVELMKHLSVFDKENSSGMACGFYGVRYHDDSLSVSVYIGENAEQVVG